MEYVGENLEVCGLKLSCHIHGKVAMFYIQDGKLRDENSLNDIFDYIYEYLKKQNFTGCVNIHTENIIIDSNDLKISSKLLNYKEKLHIDISLTMKDGILSIANIENELLILTFSSSQFNNINLNNLKMKSINFFCTRITGNLVAENAERITILNEWCKRK